MILVGAQQVAPLRQGLLDAGFDAQMITQVMTMKEAFACIEDDGHEDKVALIENDVPEVLNH